MLDSNTCNRILHIECNEGNEDISAECGECSNPLSLNCIVPLRIGCVKTLFLKPAKFYEFVAKIEDIIIAF